MMEIANDIEQRIISITRDMAAPPDQVFAAWADCDPARCWRAPEDFSVTRCELDFRQGGGYRFCMRAPDGTEQCSRGEFTHVDAPGRLVFTWLREDSTGDIWCDTVVSITIKEQEGGSRVNVEQTAFATEEQCAEHRGGWNELLDRLSSCVAHEPVEPPIA